MTITMAISMAIPMTVMMTVIGVREKEGSGTSPLNSVSDGNMCPTENYIPQQQQQQQQQ